MMKCSFDGIGYVNNLGRSKYWGVNRQRYNGRDYGWRISLATGDGTSSKHIYPTWDMTETEAAHIAAAFYENPLSVHGLERSVKSKDGNYEYRINNQGQIKKFDSKFGTTQGLPTRYEVVGQAIKSNKTPIVHNWSSRSIKMLREMIDLSINDPSADKDFFEMVKNIAEINLK